MTTQNTLLAHIVPMYGKTELVAIEALKYILEQSEAARTALESMLYAGGVGVGSLMRFQTEALGDESERVDLVCYDASGDELGPAFARRMLQLPQLIDDATDRARSAGWVSTERLSRTPWATGYGRYMQLAGVYSRFDVNFYYWANLGDTPYG